MLRFFITYKLDGMTEYSGTRDVIDSYKTKADAQRALQELKRFHPDIKGWRIVQARA